MANTFFIGDMHFGHKKIAPLRGFETPEQHDEELIRRWNSVVRKVDVVHVLGDFCFGRKNIALAEHLNGIKKLVMGNHDLYPAAEYLKYFHRVSGAMPYNNGVMTHIPVHPDQLQRYRFNIHGHLHTHDLGRPQEYINVSAEQINLTPISWEDLRRKHNV